MDTRLASTAELRVAAERSRAEGFNRQVSVRLADQLDVDGTHLIIPLMVHEHVGGELAVPHLRCKVMMKLTGRSAPYNEVADFRCDDVESLRVVQQDIA